MKTLREMMDLVEAVQKEGTVELWNPSEPVYHGTNQKFSRDVVPGMWISTEQEDAEQYAEELGYGDGGIYTIHLKPHKMMWMNDCNDLPSDLPKDVASVFDGQWGRIIDPAIIQSMQYTDSKDLTEKELDEASGDTIKKIDDLFKDKR